MRHFYWALAAILFLSGRDLPAALDVAPRAGAPFLVDVWTTENGLPQNSVLSLLQTRDGFLWLGTVNGLVRFDGLHFNVFDESNTPHLRSPIISLFEDSRTNLWIGTKRNGVVLVRPGEIVNLDIGRGGQEKALASICEDQHATVWLYTGDGELWSYQDGQTNRVWRDNQPASAGYRGIIVEQSGLLWVGTDRKLTALQPPAKPGAEPVVRHTVKPNARLDFLLPSRTGGHWRFIDGHIQKWTGDHLDRDLGTYPWLASPSSSQIKVQAASEDAEGNLLVGTKEAGVFWFDAEGNTTIISTNEGLSYNLVLSVLVDRQGGLWVGTDGGGLNRVKRQIFDLLEETRSWVVQSVAEDERGGIWIGSNGTGIGYWLEGSWLPFKLFTNTYLRSVYDDIRSVYVDREHRVWAGTPIAGLYQLPPSASVAGGVSQDDSGSGAFQQPGFFQFLYNFGPISVIHQDRRGQLWCGTESGLANPFLDQLTNWQLRAWTAKDGLTATNVQAIADDPDGNLWIGSLGGGLNRFRDGKFYSFSLADGLPSEDISSLHVDNAGVLWIGTPGRGLARFHQGKWTYYTKREGLISNSIGYLLEDGEGFLWIGSNAGLMRLRKRELNDFAAGTISGITCRVYGTADGLPSGECTQGSQPGAIRTRDGRLWFPTIKGLVSVDPAQIKPNPYPPPVMIEAVLLEGEIVNTNALSTRWPAEITIPPGRERLEIQYTSVNFADPQRARFRYRLINHETAWTYAGNTRLARYSKLPPGHYQFHVTAANEDGVWNETGAILPLFVQPPFWRTWWFLTASTMALLGAIVGGVHYFSTQKLHRQVEQLRQHETLEKERARIARDLHDQLGASLTQVALLGEMAESDRNFPEEVETHARQISQTARDTTRVLDEIVWTVNPSNDTLEGLITYVCKYAQDFLAVAGVRYRLEVPAQLPASQLLPDVRHNVFLAAKEAITNVVRHAQATEVKLGLQLAPDHFTLEIQDNGKGVIGLDKKTTRHGLKNMRKRMEDIGGAFRIEPAPEGGTRVSLTAPLQEELKK